MKCPFYKIETELSNKDNILCDKYRFFLMDALNKARVLVRGAKQQCGDCKTLISVAMFKCLKGK